MRPVVHCNGCSGRKLVISSPERSSGPDIFTSFEMRRAHYSCRHHLFQAHPTFQPKQSRTVLAPFNHIFLVGIIFIEAKCQTFPFTVDQHQKHNKRKQLGFSLWHFRATALICPRAAKCTRARRNTQGGQRMSAVLKILSQQTLSCTHIGTSQCVDASWLVFLKGQEERDSWHQNWPDPLQKKICLVDLRSPQIQSRIGLPVAIRVPGPCS